MDEMRYWSIRRLGEAYRRGETRPTAQAAALLERIVAEEGRLHAYAHIAPDLAMAQAEQAERELAAGLDRGPLHGVPIAVKDLCATKDMPTYAGMPRLDPFMAGQDSTVVERLRRAGAVIPGKLQMTEGATALHHPDLTPPVNPWSADRWTGVSSSGSGVATAAGLCQASLGSDTGGSIRMPSSCCGLTGVKPTWGLVSRAGVFPLAESLDHVGPMARSAEDAAFVLAAIAGPDPADPSTLLDPPPNYPALLDASLSGVGVDETLIRDDVDPEVSAAVLAAVAVFAELGAAVSPIALASFSEAVAQGMACFPPEIALVHAATYPSRADAYGPAIRVMLDEGAKMGVRDLILAQRSRIATRRMIDMALTHVRFLVLPALPMVAPSVADGAAIAYDLAKQRRLTRFTAIFDLTGHPTVTLPCGFDAEGVPIGAQLVGRAQDEAFLLATAHAFQKVTDFHVRRPPL